jgi:hypothetical protein
MDLSDSQNLIKTPNFTGLPKLERVIFQGCTRLDEVHPSIGVLKGLTLLNLEDCKCLNSLPLEIDLESLETLILFGCSRLKKFPDIGTSMTRLSGLYLDRTAIINCAFNWPDFIVSSRLQQLFEFSECHL